MTAASLWPSADRQLDWRAVTEAPDGRRCKAAIHDTKPDQSRVSVFGAGLVAKYDAADPDRVVRLSRCIQFLESHGLRIIEVISGKSGGKPMDQSTAGSGDKMSEKEAESPSDQVMAREVRDKLMPVLEQACGIISDARRKGLAVSFNLAPDQYGIQRIVALDIVKPLPL